MQKEYVIVTQARELIFDPQLATSPSLLTINYFYSVFQREALILRPPFQRNMVWNREQQSFLIDSILRGLPVPEIYIQTKTSAEGDERTIIVDGQQRLSAFIQFIDDDLRLVLDADFDARWSGKKFSELDPDLRRTFRSYEIIARKLPDVGDEVLREIFRRLNKTVEPLEPQELRHAAYTGPFIHLIEDAGDYSILEELGVFSAKDYLRRRNDELMAEIAFAVSSKAYPNKKEGLDELFLTYERHGIPAATLEDLERRFGRAFATIGPIASQLRRTRFRNKSDFYSLFTYLAKNAETLPITQEKQEIFVAVIKEFSNSVNEIKKLEVDGQPTESQVSSDFGKAALKYLRAVERAASDRLTRVRREDALNSVLGPEVTARAPRPLSIEDSEWRISVEESNFESDDGAPTDEEREHARDVLLDED